jgi:ABC-type nickel/cobalt efflux system permease component RcnA
MAQFLSMAFLGFFLGMRHATDPDHVVAVTTIVSRERRVDRAGGIGMLWGLGHTATILLVGGAILIFDVVIPPRIGLTMEFSVAVMLVLLGVLSVGHRLDSHRHSGDATAETKGERGSIFHHQSLRPLAIGVVHGLAGSAAIALLVLATISNPMWGVVYLAVFGIGTIAGMMLITAAISIPFAYTSRRLAGFNRSLGFASGLSSLVFGMFLIYQIAFVDGLFRGYAHWTPR